jgi:hypothetical protein
MIGSVSLVTTAFYVVYFFSKKEPVKCVRFTNAKIAYEVENLYDLCYIAAFCCTA